MITISRLNATVSDHSTTANIIAFGLLTAMTIISAATINYSGQLTKASYEMPFTLATPKQTSVATTPSKAQAIPQASTITLSNVDASTPTLQGQQPNIVAELQPAMGLSYNSQVSASTLQPSTNSIQLTGNGLQNAAGIR